MLMLTRKVGESIMVGDDVQITVVGVQGITVRLGITAPSQVKVHRQEIYERIQKAPPE